MGHLSVGDTIFNEIGIPTKVIYCSPVTLSQECYRLTFDDGSILEADAEHLWVTFDARELRALTRIDETWRSKRRATRASRAQGNKSELFRATISARNSRHSPATRTAPTGTVRTTKTIVDSLRTRKGRANHAIPVTHPLVCDERNLRLDPYILGLWLGDGSTGSGGFTSADLEIIDSIRQAGYSVKKGDRYNWYVKKLITDLKAIGVGKTKFVPQEYFRGSYAQRLALLQGLMDTDGTVAKHSGRAQFANTNYLLIDAVHELATSLGWKPTITSKKARIYEKDYGMCWTVSFMPTVSVFRLQRKASLQSLSQRRTTRFRYIVSAERITPQLMRCLTVDSPSHLYLAGESMIPTHNTWTLLLEPIYHKDVPGFRAVMFRRTMPNITNAGSMWDQSAKLYPHAQAKPNASKYHWTFPSEARVEFASLQHAKTVLEWKSAEIALLGFDQIEEFTEDQFWYMISRNRSTCGVPPYVRCTVNPVPADDAIGGWVHKLIQWWLDPETGLPIKERDGIVRWFIRINEEIKWYNSKQDAVTAAIGYGFEPEKAAILPKSLSFIAARLEDNKKLMEVDPGYYANLMSMPLVERERLYGGNWNVKPTAGRVFNRAWFTIVPMAPLDVQCVRYWDKAGTEEKENPNAAFTAGVKMGYSPSTKGFYVLDVVHGQWQARERENVIRQCAEIDGSGVTVWVEQEPGSGGKESAKNTIINTLAGYACFADRVKGDKYIRSQPFAAMVQAYNVYLVKGDWNDGYLTELHAFEPEGAGRKDRVDASSGAFNKLTAGKPMDLITAVPLTEEERQKELDEKAQDFARRVQMTGAYFPGD